MYKKKKRSTTTWNDKASAVIIVRNKKIYFQALIMEHTYFLHLRFFVCLFVFLIFSFSHFGNKSLLFLNSPCSYSIKQSTYIWTPLMWIKFTCAILPISSISRLTIAHMWSKGVGAVCILVTGMVFFTLVNVYKLTDRKEGIRIMQNLSCISQHRVKRCKPWLSSTFCWLLIENARLSYTKKTSCLCKKL